MGEMIPLPPLATVACGRDGPKVIRAGELSPPLTSCSTRTWVSGPVPHLGSTVEMALMVWALETDPEDLKAELAPPLAHHWRAHPGAEDGDRAGGLTNHPTTTQTQN